MTIALLHYRTIGLLSEIIVDLQGLVEYIAKNLVEDQSQVSVNVIESSSAITLELRVAPDDMGRVIGKSGRIANAIRTLVRVAAAREGKRVNLEIV
jgi:predicted RNA-binding protein YlqC (UPF0109 family)